jgi:hypothetical protein
MEIWNIPLSSKNKKSPEEEIVAKNYCNIP